MITINRPIEDLYRFWRNLENLPRFMRHLESVERLPTRCRVGGARARADSIVEWNAEIINEVPNQVIGWRSIEGSDVVSAGSVNFDDAGPGAARTSACGCSTARRAARSGAVAKLLGRDAATEIREDLRRFKQLVETGESRTERKVRQADRRHSDSTRLRLFEAAARSVSAVASDGAHLDSL